MLHPHEREYDLSKPPIILVQRKEAFVCGICKKPGVGPPNTLVHPGRCRDAYTRDKSKRSWQNAKAKKLRMLAPQQGSSC